MSTEFTEPAAFNPTPAREPRIPIVIPQRVAERAATRCVRDANGCLDRLRRTGSKWVCTDCYRVYQERYRNRKRQRAAQGA